MAEINPKYKRLARSKQGLFDVRGTMNGAVLRHDQLFEELLNNSNLYNCFEKYQGEFHILSIKHNPSVSILHIIIDG